MPELTAREETVEAAFRLADVVVRGYDAEPRPRGIAGYAGFAIVFAALAEAGRNDALRAMHDALRRSATSGIRDCGLARGIAGTRAAAAVAMRLEPRYASLVAQCDAYLDEAVRVPDAPAVAYHCFDLLEGWAGIALARSIAPVAGKPEIDALVWLLADERRWFARHPFNGEGPHHNLSMAHGLAGMLAALGAHEARPSIARMVLKEALRIRSSIVGDAGARTMPPWLPIASSPPYADGWCYGAAAAAASIFSVGRAFHDAELCAWARELVEETMARLTDRSVHDTGICHGIAGHVLMCASMAASTGSEHLAECTRRLSRRLVEAVREPAFFEHDVDLNAIEGIASIVLALLAVARVCSTGWMRIYGITPLD